MKPILLLCLALCSCEPPDPAVSSGTVEYGMGNGTGTITIKTIVIEGNEYLAFKTSDGRWGLCPKLPPKGEGVMPARPAPPFKPPVSTP